MYRLTLWPQGNIPGMSHLLVHHRLPLCSWQRAKAITTSQQRERISPRQVPTTHLFFYPQPAASHVLIKETLSCNEHRHMWMVYNEIHARYVVCSSFHRSLLLLLSTLLLWFMPSTWTQSGKGSYWQVPLSDGWGNTAEKVGMRDCESQIWEVECVNQTNVILDKSAMMTTLWSAFLSTVPPTIFLLFNHTLH